MPLFKRRSREPPTMLGYWLRSSGDCPVGYHRLLDTPEVAACISRISAIISSVPIYLMENTRKGDVRVHDGLSRLVDIDPWPGMATRSGWMDWIVSTMLGEGDGNAFVLPQIEAVSRRWFQCQARRPFPETRRMTTVSAGAGCSTIPPRCSTSACSPIRSPPGRGAGIGFLFRRWWIPCKTPQPFAEA